MTKIICGVLLCFSFSQSVQGQNSFRTGIALNKYLESIYRHKYEVVEVGELFLKARDVFEGVIMQSEWAVLEKHLLNYLRIHDDPKIWERERLLEFGYPSHLPTIKSFLASSHGVSFQSLPEKDIAHEVRSALNKTEATFKDSWKKSQGINKHQYRSLMFWEHYLDILATRLSADRSKELDVRYPIYSGTEWMVRVNGTKYADELTDRMESLKDFEKRYFHFVKQTRCARHLGDIQ